MIQLSVTWKRIWYNPRYERGQIHGDKMGVKKIYQHSKTGWPVQIRLYSDFDMRGQKLSVNGEKAVMLRKFGKLYLGFKEN